MSPLFKNYESHRTANLSVPAIICAFDLDNSIFHTHKEYSTEKNHIYSTRNISDDTVYLTLILPPPIHRNKNTSEDDYATYLIEFSKKIFIDDLKEIKGFVVCDFFKEAKHKVITHKNEQINFIYLNTFIDEIYIQREFRESYRSRGGIEFYRNFQVSYANRLIKKLREIPAGTQGTTKDTNINSNIYKCLTKEIFDFLFDSSNIPLGQVEHANRTLENRRDIIYDISMCNNDDFKSFTDRYDASHIIIECKNSSKKEEFEKGLDQVIRYMESSCIGKFSIITMRDKREGIDKDNFWASQKDKFILLLDDNDFFDLLKNYTTNAPVKLYYENINQNFILDGENGIIHLLRKCNDQKAKT